MGAVSAAHLLVQAGVDVLFVEAGPVQASPRIASPIQVDNVGRAFGIATSRGLELGGGTAFWHGVCAPLDAIDFLPRSFVPHSGWPIRREQLDRYYALARTFLGADAPADPPASPAMRFGSSSAFLQKDYQYRTPPFRGKTLLRQWCAQGRARCVYNCVALCMHEQNGRARLLSVASAGKRFSISAEFFIIAAGALETPRLLLNSLPSSSRLQTAMPWWLGRNLIDHPVGYLSQARYKRKLARSSAPAGVLHGMQLDMEVQMELGLPNHTAFLRPGFSRRPVPNRAIMAFLGIRGPRDLALSHLASLVRHPYILWRIASQKLRLPARRPYGDLFFMTEQLPNPDSRVSLSDTRSDQSGFPLAQVDWRLGEQDLALFERFHQLAVNAMRAYPDVETIRVDAQSIWTASVCSGAHHLGTARMAAVEADGVVDPDLRLFGFDNVWIGDGSVFPTAGSANPSLTICALSHRLGTHLLGRMQPG
ncbi:GMC oxidoreductase [Massilia sp. 9I]|uniref:GMC oxidoreductase n=1 Tax=Massilia sp. 9I TaxID=2653152 RepID=UPI001E35AC3F|nr:GMC oxidoreductase [Massilia sp. 9I]